MEALACTGLETVGDRHDQQIDIHTLTVSEIATGSREGNRGGVRQRKVRTQRSSAQANQRRPIPSRSGRADVPPRQWLPRAQDILPSGPAVREGVFYVYSTLRRGRDVERDATVVHGQHRILLTQPWAFKTTPPFHDHIDTGVKSHMSLIYTVKFGTLPGLFLTVHARADETGYRLRYPSPRN